MSFLLYVPARLLPSLNNFFNIMKVVTRILMSLRAHLIVPKYHNIITYDYLYIIIVKSRMSSNYCYFLFS